MIWHTSTTLSAHITMRISCMWDLSQCCNLIGSTDEEAHKHECSRLAPPPMTTSQESACGERLPKKSAPGSKHAGEQEEKPSFREIVQPAGLASQEGSQAGDKHVTHVAGSASQESTAKSCRGATPGIRRKRRHTRRRNPGSNPACAFQLRHSLSSLHYVDSLNKLVSRSPVLVIVAFYVAIPCSCNARIWVLYLSIENIEQLNLQGNHSRNLKM